jgi:serine-type D-Ala-D-Ala carboxypeptidase
MRDSAATIAAGDLLRSAVSDRVFPAAVAEAGTSAGVLWTAAFGSLSFQADASPTTLDTVFDLASLTKPMATTTVALSLIDCGALRLDEPVAACIPEWIGVDRATATMQDLLEHSAGLSARLLDRPPHDRRAFEHDICAMPLEYRPRTRSLYSDLGFILAGFACERRGGATLAQLSEPLLRSTLQAGAPAGARLLIDVPVRERHLVAPTSPLPEDERRGRRLAGEVHDNYAAVLGGFAGHAGLFGNAAGVGAFARVVLRAVRGDASLPAPFRPAAMTRATARSAVAGSSRALGWDTMLPTSSCGSHLTPRAFGHVGFTGTSLWVDPGVDRYFVLLTNRVCDGGTSDQMQAVRRAFHDALAFL